MPKLCPDCGEDHDMLFSKRVIELYEQIVATTDAYERAELMMEMAEAFVEDTEDTDHHLGEDIHDILTEVIQTKVVSDRKQMALARILMRSLPAYVLEHAPPPEEDDTSKSN